VTYGQVLYGDRLYVGSYDNNVYAIDAGSGKLIWKFETNGFINYVGTHESGVYFGSWDCNLYCLDHNGRLKWKFRSSLAAPSSIAPPEANPAKSIQVVWTPDKQKEGEKYRGRGSELSDYGEFSGTYISKEKGDYASSRKKGYIK